MRAAVQKLDGIAAVDVQQKERRATIRCRPGSKATVEQIRQAITAAGFQPGDAEAQLRGQVTTRDGKTSLELAGASYTLTGDAALLAPAAGKTATVTVRIPSGQGRLPPLRVVAIQIEG